MAYVAGVNEFVLDTKFFQISKELSPKELRHHLDVDEKVIFARLPFPSITGQSSAGDDVVKVGMVQDVLAPGVQDAGESDFRSQMFRVFCEFRQRLRTGFEQDPIEGFLIPEDKRIQLVGEGEDDVEVLYGEQVFFPVLDPLFLLQELALGTVPISAGVVRDHLCPAVLALIHVAA